MKEKILLTTRDSKNIVKKIIKDEAQKENFYYRYGKYFKYGNIKLTYEDWKKKGCSVRRIIQLERDRRRKIK